MSRRYKLTETNRRGPFPVRARPSAIAAGAVLGAETLILVGAAPVRWALATDLVLVLLPLKRERLREQWTWTAWLGAAIAGAAGAGTAVAHGSGGGFRGLVEGAAIAVALSAVFIARNGRSEPAAHRWRLVGLSGLVLALSAIAAALAGAA